MAFVLVQHLDPTHESMMVDLLAAHTPLAIRQATSGMSIEGGHLYVIPPGVYIGVENGALALSQPTERHGARMPFDFFLASLASEFGPRAACVVLSGTGADGSAGLQAIQKVGGLVIAQEPDEATYDGMPRNAIATGAVDLVLPIAEMFAALSRFEADAADIPEQERREDAATPWFARVIELLRTKTAHDFRLYKPGTLERRIARRMGMAGLDEENADKYLDLLERDGEELETLASDLLINVTSFFRDPKVFETLAGTIIPDLVTSHTDERPLRVWIAGCSTGEETYSFAMLFREAILASQRAIKLQVFASDVDPDAVSTAREGVYPESIEADVSPERLARFFIKEGHSYRIVPDLRADVVFTVQDVLADPPFSRLDLVSCRNLLIYLRPEAQAKVISLFHFALRDGGVLVLGSSETINSIEGRFEVISKPDRLYRHIGRRRPGDLNFAMGGRDTPRAPTRPGEVRVATARRGVLADLAWQLVMETYAPAAVLVNQRYEWLYSLGPTERYLRVPPGHPTADLLAMVPHEVRTRLRSAVQRATQDNARILVSGVRAAPGDEAMFGIDVRPVLHEGQTLLLICFVDEETGSRIANRAAEPQDQSRIDELERDLHATRTELEGAIRNLEMSGDEQLAINEEALSVNEEFQSTNEELLTSKEELQSLNKELTALNTQLQETLGRQRLLSNDLENVLYSTDVATLFLDRELNIRFFTPATKSLFRVIQGDVGRPIADLTALSDDGTLLRDARAVLDNLLPVQQEVQAPGDIWYLRRILPYRTQQNGVEGVVVTFSDVTERKKISKALELAKRQAEQGNLAKSRFLAAASHDLRQPLQTLVLLQGLLADSVTNEKSRTLVTRLEEALGAMSGILNTLLDINKIDADTVVAEISDFAVDDLLDRLRNEFAYHAVASGLDLRFVRSSLKVRSDPRLLEQMLRNLLSNALKYTPSGKVLLGCRRQGERVLIQIWDTGIGIPSEELEAIFDEYHQIDNAARERHRGLGLGLAIVQRLAQLLGSPVSVQSRVGAGSVFSIDIMRVQGDPDAREDANPSASRESGGQVRQLAEILVVEDDPEVRDLLEQIMSGEGHRVAVAHDGPAALRLAVKGAIAPDIILADYNLPNGMNGVETTGALRASLGQDIPVIILTGDISAQTLRDIALHQCVHMHKPLKLRELTQAVQDLIAGARRRLSVRQESEPKRDGIIYVVDDERNVRKALRGMLEADGRTVEDYESGELFLGSWRPGAGATLIIDAYMPRRSGLDVLRRVRNAVPPLPTIMITGKSDVGIAVEAMKQGAADFVEKPIKHADLLASIDRAVEQARDEQARSASRDSAAGILATLTARQRRIMDMVLAGHPSKNIAADLGISQRTVENHRAAIMKKTGCGSIPALARLVVAAGSPDNHDFF